VEKARRQIQNPDSAEEPNSPKKGSETDHQNTLPENQNGLYAILERIFLILFSRSFLLF